MSSPRIEVHDDRPALAAAVAGALVSRLAAAQSRSSIPQVALTGGSVADAVHRSLARLATSSDSDSPEVDWGRVGFWWGDERFVARDSPDRNARAARAAFLEPAVVGPAQVHEVGSADDHATPAEAATAYGAELRAHVGEGFDVVMLGVGPDGHVASLFPGHPALDADTLAVAVTDAPKPPPDRVSLSFRALNHTRATWLVVSGSEKADAVARALAGADLPAAHVHGSEETVWFLDRGAAFDL